MNEPYSQNKSLISVVLGRLLYFGAYVELHLNITYAQSKYWNRPTCGLPLPKANSMALIQTNQRLELFVPSLIH